MSASASALGMAWTSGRRNNRYRNMVIITEWVTSWPLWRQVCLRLYICAGAAAGKEIEVAFKL